MPLKDQTARDRFMSELDRNFSVIAPAGVGKTRSIVDRSVNLALSNADPDFLSRIAVVTYTNKAADEMQQRARNSLLAHPKGTLLSGSFNRIFFGTIHSFCVNLLRAHGHYLGMPAQIQLIDDDQMQETWTRYFLHLDLEEINATVGLDVVHSCLKYLPTQKLLDLAKTVDPGTVAPDLTEECPATEINAILAYAPDRAPSGTTKKNLDLAMKIASEWAEREKGGGFNPIPSCPSGSKGMVEAWNDSFAPLRSWLGKASLAIGCAVAANFRRYRVGLGLLTYADQVSLALDLLAHSIAGPAIRNLGYRVILDEAQDTDPDQFNVLLEVTRPPEAKGLWLVDGSAPPRQGHFCMVGDPQQSIYGSRASTGFYLNVIEKLVDWSAGETLIFSVTFRCSESVVKRANEMYPSILTGKDGQVDYVQLKPRDGAPEGAVVRFRPDCAMPEGGKLNTDGKSNLEAEAVAAWLKGKTAAQLGARDWSQVAILCPRRKWLTHFELALIARNMPVQNLSRNQKAGDTPALKWFTAIMTCFAEPDNHFEITGVLRDVFGISDEALHEFCEGDSALLTIATVSEEKHAVAQLLRALAELRAEAIALPLADAVRRIIQRTGLPAKLAALDPFVSCDSVPVLDQISAMAATAESADMDISEWTENLRRMLNTKLEFPEPPRNAIQLLTCQSAKGLEWDCVILPMLFRDISSHSPDYPRIIGTPAKRQANAAFEKSWISDKEDAAYKTTVIQEHQRLLYVSMTRPRSTLILVDDQHIFDKDSSFADVMGLRSEAPQKTWDQLPRELPAFTDTKGKKDAAQELSATIPAPVAAKDLKSAIETASAFSDRVLPHSLAVHGTDAEPEASRSVDPEWDSRVGELAKNYGLWWHSLMEALDWNDTALWQNTYEEAMAACPIPERGQPEWQLFSKSDTAKYLSSPEVEVRTEVPFLFRASDSKSIEGFIDLLAITMDSREALILDWKTNNITTHETERLADIYRPQLSAYADAVSAMVSDLKSVSTALYSSATGLQLDL